MATLAITDAEFAVLEALWKHQPQTIRELTGRLYPGSSVSDYATVQKLLERLEAKRCVRRDRSEHAHVFTATRDRSDLIDSQLQQLADKLCEGSLTPVLLHLVQATKLSKREREILRQMLDDARDKKSTGRRLP
jgi:BlaI family transcriptional regulator, penicillinase repressor